MLLVRMHLHWRKKCIKHFVSVVLVCEAGECLVWRDSSSEHYVSGYFFLETFQNPEKGADREEIKCRKHFSNTSRKQTTKNGTLSLVRNRFLNGNHCLTDISKFSSMQGVSDSPLQSFEPWIRFFGWIWAHGFVADPLYIFGSKLCTCRKNCSYSSNAVRLCCCCHHFYARKSTMKTLDQFSSQLRPQHDIYI